MAFTLPELPYGYDALEPHIDARTMEIHHTKHHAAYVANLNKAIEGTDMEKLSLKELMANISKYPVAVRNNGGGHYNHAMFWKIMTPDGGGEPGSQMNIYKAIVRDFGSFAAFKEAFATAGATRFGSGWAWLCVDNNDKLFITSTPNQDNPLMDVAEKQGVPVLGLDVWEHAYYLNYQNRRPDYIQSFFNLINWQEVTENYNNANPGASKG